MSISDATSGATIYYTTNGTTPTTSSTLYTGPITVSSTETLQAIAVDTGDTNSAVASAAYTITSAATYGLNADLFTRRGDLYLRAVGDHLRYHLRRNHLLHHQRNDAYHLLDPVHRPDHGQLTETLEAIAVDTGDTNSAVASAAYTINSVATYGLNADILTRRGGLYLRAVGDHLRCHLRRNHLLHHQRNYPYHVLDLVHRPDYGELDGDAGGDRGRHRRHQQRGRVRCLHHKLAA